MEFIEFVRTINFSNIIWEILTPLIFSFVDILTGCIQAFINNNFSSSEMRKGLLHKASIILCLLLSFVVQFTFNLNLVPKVVAVYIIIMEVYSIYENLKKAGIKFVSVSDLFKK